MTERSRPWGGTVTGDAGPYSDDQWHNTWRSIIGSQDANEGVFQDQLNELAVSGTATPVSVASGRSLVRGGWYESDAAVTVAIPTPSVSTRIDRIVLRKSWTAQTIRIARVAGVEGAGAPALTQSNGVTWEIPLAQASITTGGVITVTDERTFIGNIAVRVGTLANIPAAPPYDGRFFYYATDDDSLWYPDSGAWVQVILNHDDLSGVSANDHHNQAHDIEGADHTASGLTAGHVMRATAATTFAFQAIQEADIPATIARDSEVPTEASQAQMEAETAGFLFTPPDLVRNSPGVSKAWGRVSSAGTLGSPSYNVTSVVRNAGGDYTVTLGTDFSDVDYTIEAGLLGNSGGRINHFNVAVGTFDIYTFNSAGTQVDGEFTFSCHGDQ